VLAVGLATGQTLAKSGDAALPTKAAELYQPTKVWTVHLKFTPQEWDAMEPKSGGFGRFGGPGGPRGGPRGGGGGGGFGPGMFIAPAFLALGDRDKDGKLSKAEFEGMAEAWFKTWDKDDKGSLNGDQLRAGINVTFAPPPGAPGGPGGPGGGGVGRMLQGPEGKRNGLASAAGIEFKYVHADLDFDGTTLKDVAVRYKGNGTWMQSQGSTKRSMKIDINQHVKGQKLAGVTSLNLHSNVTDATEMNEPLSHRLYRDAGVPAPRTAYAKVYVTVPGKHERTYLGLYSMIEDVDKTFIKDEAKHKGGAIFKPVTPNLFADLGNDWAKYKQAYDPKTELSDKQIRRVIDFSRLLTAADDAAFAAKVGDYLDLEEFARFMAVTAWLSTHDSILGMGQNFYVYLDPKTDKFQFIPWDLDHSFGQFPMAGSQEQREKLSIRHPWRGDVRLLERVFKVPAFEKIYLAKMREFSGTIFNPERFKQQVDEVAAAIRPGIQEESAAKLERFDKAVAGEMVDPMRGFGGGGGPRFGGFTMVKPIKAFVGPRAESVKEQLAGTSEGETLSAGFGGGRGGPQPMQAGTFLGPAFMTALDADKDGQLTRAEMTGGFAKWFEAWNTDNSGSLTDEQVRAGINKDLGFRPPFGVPPGGPPGRP
jgi:spore coat protein CotH